MIFAAELYLFNNNRPPYEITVAIKDLIKNKEVRQQIAENAKKIAKEKHDSVNVSNEFKSLICSITLKN